MGKKKGSKIKVVSAEDSLDGSSAELAPLSNGSEHFEKKNSNKSMHPHNKSKEMPHTKLKEEIPQPSLSKVMIFGLILAVCGLVVLLRNYILEGLYTAWSVEGLGVALLVSGVVIYVAGSYSNGAELQKEMEILEEEEEEEDEHDEDAHFSFKFVKLNRLHKKDARKYMEEAENIHRPLPANVEKLLEKKRKEVSKKHSDEEDKADQAMEEEVKTELAAGASIRDVTLKRRRTVYVVEFSGDIQASQVHFLRRAVTLLIDVASAHDEVVIRLTSPGGLVSEYGLAGAQLLRLRNAGLHLTVCVDTVAASGGYLMACVAHSIIASPFAYIGSVGVVAQVPNFHRVLDKNDVDFMEFTAGQYKRTVTLFGEVDEGRKAKFQETLVDIHRAFKAHVLQNRPHVDVEKIGTGEYWLASQARDKGLVDVIMTSDEYLALKMATFQVVELRRQRKRKHGFLRTLLSRFILATVGHQSMSTLSQRLWSYVTSPTSWLRSPDEMQTRHAFPAQFLHRDHALM